MTKVVRTPLRYPGGKSRAIDQILPLIPQDFKEFREPFLGGGSIFLAQKQRYPQRKYWVNDLNYDLYCFWKALQEQSENLLTAVQNVRENRQDGKALFYELRDESIERNDFERAVRFFVLNRISFSGTVDSGGYSEKAFQGRFTPSSIERLSYVPPLLEETHITTCDYEELLKAEGEGVFLFLDPPYYSATHSRLYGKRGKLHTGFDHARFARCMKACPHRWLITYDDCPEIYDAFSFAHCHRWELQYGMNNFKQTHAAKGKELLLSNYPINLRADSTPLTQLEMLF